MPESHSSYHRHNMPRARLALAISTALLGLTPGWLAAQDLPKNDSGVINKTDASQVEVIEVKRYPWQHHVGARPEAVCRHR